MQNKRKYVGPIFLIIFTMLFTQIDSQVMPISSAASVSPTKAASSSAFSPSPASPVPAVSFGQNPGRLQVGEARITGYSVQASDVSPTSDPYYERQWSLQAAEIPQAWALGAAGQEITIAIVDTGVDVNHPDLKDHLVPGYSVIRKSTKWEDIQDDQGHGTCVAGIAAAGLNGQGIVGVAYQAKIMPVKAMGSDGKGTDEDVAAGILWAAEHGAKIINLSVGSQDENGILRQAIEKATQQGCLLIAAAGNFESGNSNPGVNYPASDPKVLAVTATDADNQLASYSNTGKEAVLAAPGDKILSDYWSLKQGSGYVLASGTSMAAAFVSGAAALIWSEHPEWSADQVRTALTDGAQHLNEQGRTHSFGYGLVNPYRALEINQPLAELPSPAALDYRGGIVCPSSDFKVQAVIPVLSFDQTQTVSLTKAEPPGKFPEGIIAGSESYTLTWSEQAALHKAITLSFETQAPANKEMGYIFHWSGSRWILVGGGTAGTVNAEVYEQGIYCVGYFPSPSGDRLAGQDRIETAVKIAEAAFPTGTDTVIISRADDFPDALAGTPLAYKYHAPILLTGSSRLDERVWAELQKLAPKKILLLGGTGAISAEIESQLKGWTSVRRIGGENRYATAAAIAQELGTMGRAALVNGENFPDALSIAAVAAQKGEPVLLTNPTVLPAETDQVLRQLLVTQCEVAGGEGAVSPEVFAQLPDPVRLAGSDRYTTSVRILQKNPPSTDGILYLATGENYPDALAGGVLAASRGSALILVPQDGLTDGQQEEIRSWGISGLTAIGGSGAVPDKVLREVQSLRP